MVRVNWQAGRGILPKGGRQVVSSWLGLAGRKEYTVQRWQAGAACSTVSDRKKEPALERPVVGSVEGYHEVWNNLRKVAGRVSFTFLKGCFRESRSWLLKVADRVSLTVKGCREVEGACSRVAGRLNLIVNCRRHVV